MLGRVSPLKAGKNKLGDVPWLYFCSPALHDSQGKWDTLCTFSSPGGLHCQLVLSFKQTSRVIIVSLHFTRELEKFPGEINVMAGTQIVIVSTLKNFSLLAGLAMLLVWTESAKSSPC